MANVPAAFPAMLEIDYPDRDLNRLTTFFRPFTVIPIAIVLTLVSGSTVRATSGKYLVASGGTSRCCVTSIPRRTAPKRCTSIFLIRMRNTSSIAGCR